MKEPQRIKLDPTTPTHKNVNKIPMPSVYKPEWDVFGQDNDDVYVPLDKKDEDNSENHQTSIS